MKTSKAAMRSSAQEECGVWLDTVQLKEKAKQKCRDRPISKLLNPLVGGGGYSLTVALNFTQTKMEMPKTKQSSISAFFAPKRRVLHKMSTADTPNLDPVQPSSPSFKNEPFAVPPVRKRARQTLSEKSDPEDSDAGVDSDLEKENVAETEAIQTCQTDRTPNLVLLNGKSAECNPPPIKRRINMSSMLRNDSQTSQQTWSQDPLFKCSEYSDEFRSSGSSVLDSVHNSDGFGDIMKLEGKTSTQKSAENCSQRKDGKENSTLISCKSPSKHIPLSQLGILSNHKRAGLTNASTQKQPDQSGNWLVKEAHLDSLWRKPRSSPVKKQQKCSEADEDSVATLFTQDSEGLRVISHRCLQTRSPLKDQSSLKTGLVRRCAYKSLEEQEDEEEDDEVLFTQDSQGNMVIKH